ncbi:Protein DOG1-like 3 [Linum grandiflorum]
MPTMSAARATTSTSIGSFKDFFERWLEEQEQLLKVLTSAAADNGRNQPEFLRVLAGRVMEHYENYYRAKSEWARHDVLAMLSPSWTSSLEDAFLWIGGWRPSTAFHLLYSKSGLQFSACAADHSTVQGVLRTLNSADLAGLSTAQFRCMDELQRLTIKEEKTITEKMAKVQESAADASMVELSHTITQMMMMHGDGGNPVRPSLLHDRVDMALMPKEKKLEEILQLADDLRISTLRVIVVDILTPIQAVHFLIAVAELHLRIHDWGKQRDAGALGRGPPSSST